MKATKTSQSKLASVILLFALCILLPSTLLAADGECTCFDSEGKAATADATDECNDFCGAGVTAEVDNGVCSCDDGTGSPISETLTCETSCAAAGYSHVSGGSTSSSSNSLALITPTLNVDIPGLDLQDAISAEGDYLHVDLIGTYITGFYNYILGFSTIAAIVMIMIGGFQYAIAGGYGDTGKAKTRIKNAVTGLILVMCVYLILWTVNPQLVNPGELVLVNVKEDPLAEYNLETCKGVKGMVSACTVQKLKKPSGWNDSNSDTLVALVNEKANEHGVDPIHLAAHLEIETGGTPNWDGSTRGPCGEIGVAQFMPTSFESTVGQQCCVVSAARDSDYGERVAADCDDGFHDEWPPDDSLFDPTYCKTDICGTCQIALDSCVEYFNTTTTEGLTNTIDAMAKFVARRIAQSDGDIAMAMCAYNGSGSQAAHYAETAAGHYRDFCVQSGGTSN